MVWATQLFLGKLVFQMIALFIAQHATATCCRGCFQKWHGIKKGRALNEVEVDYVVALIMGWIEGQL
jgi:exodeoxyribonuclease V alpha subunit